MLRLVLVFALLFVGCAPPVRTVVDASGYAHKKYDLKVKSLENDLLMPEGWELDSHYWKAKVGRDDLVPKEGDEYVIEYRFDLDGDGEFEFKADEYAFELRFEHLEHDGVIFLRAIPLSSNQEKKRLNVVLDRYLEQVAGAGYEVVQLGETHVLIEKRYAAALVSKEDARVAKREALAARIEVANLDRIKIDPNARKQQVELLLVKTDFSYSLRTHNMEHEFPVLMVAGYANQPAEFEEGLPEFHDFLNRIQISGNSGYKPAKLAAPQPAEATEAKEPEADPASEQDDPVDESSGGLDAADGDGETGEEAPEAAGTPDSKSLSPAKTAPESMSTPKKSLSRGRGAVAPEAASED